jgi:hypothetical protein
VPVTQYRVSVPSSRSRPNAGWPPGLTELQAETFSPIQAARPAGESCSAAPSVDGLVDCSCAYPPSPAVHAVTSAANFSSAIAQDPCHQPVPERGDRGGRKPARRRGGGKSEPRQRRHHHGERVRGIAAVRSRVGQQRDQVQVLTERAGPAVGQQQRQRVRAPSGRVYQVDPLAVHGDFAVGQLVQPGLERGHVEPLPVRQQRGQPGPGHAAGPALPVRRGQPGPRQPLPQVIERVPGQGDPDIPDSARIGHPASMPGLTRPVTR